MCSLLVSANVPRSLIFSTLKFEATHSFETSVLIRLTLRHNPKDDILELWFCSQMLKVSS